MAWERAVQPVTQRNRDGSIMYRRCFRFTSCRDLLWTAFLLGLASFFLALGTAVRTQEDISGKLIRLHVLANSDSAEDQALKMTVRDAVLREVEELLSGDEDSPAAASALEERDRAAALLKEHLSGLEAAAEAVLVRNGRVDRVRTELTETYFPTREYDGFALPAGQYLALRVVIGEGAGRNWWCVVFPPLCGGAAVPVQTAETPVQTAETVVIPETVEKRTASEKQMPSMSADLPAPQIPSADMESSIRQTSPERTELAAQADFPTEVKPRSDADAPLEPEQSTRTKQKSEAVRSTEQSTEQKVSADSPASVRIDTVFSGPELRMVTGERYVVRFKLAEWWGRVRAVLS